MELFEIMGKDVCVLNMPERTKHAVLRRLAHVAADTAACKDFGPDEIFQKLLAREHQGSTGFGNGVAIPHTRLKGMSEFLLFLATSQRGVEFDAIDKKKVHIFFLLLGPEEKVNEHLKILAAISHVLTNSNVKREILNAHDADAAYEAFVRNSRGLAGPAGAEEKMKALFVVLYEQSFFYDILEFFVQEGIDGATILESSGMGQYVSNIPLFASFIGFMNEDKNRSRTIMTLVPESRMNDLVAGIEEITGNLDKKEGAMVFAVDVCFAKGTMKMM